MKDEVFESVKQVAEERIKNPLWGFIILSWFWFNWPNLAMLFMSDAPVKFRIDFILSQDYFYLHYIIAPVIAGGVLAALSPYAQWLLSKAHKWADDRTSDIIYQQKEKEYEDAISLSELKVRASRAEELGIAKVEADIKTEVERGKQEELNTKKLEIEKEKVREEISTLKNVLDVQKQQNESLMKYKENIQDLIVESISVLDKFFKIDDSSSIQKLKAEVLKLYSDKDIEMSAIRNKFKNDNELTNQEFGTLLDEAANKLKVNGHGQTLDNK